MRFFRSETNKKSTMTKIKFGTDGWRAIIAKDYTVDNVSRVAKATADWLNKNYESPSVCIGHDCRFAGQLFTETATKVLLHNGVKVFMAKDYISTPGVSMAVVNYKASLGVVITASHNPPDYNGYKLKGDFGGPLLPAEIQEVEDLIPEAYPVPDLDLSAQEASGQLVVVDMEQDYIDAVKEAFDLDTIYKSGLRLGYDAMYGAGQSVIRRLFPDALLVHCTENPSFEGQAPEPIERNLQPFAEAIKAAGNVDLGIATDGDADRIGLFNKKGEFVDSHRVILLLIHYLHKYKNFTGKVVTAFSTSIRINQLCAAYGIESVTTKIGFKHIAGYMVNDDVMVGGEESGGIAAKGHIPERDGIWMGLILLEFMAKSGKSLDDLLEEVYQVIGNFAYDRNDLRLPEAKKVEVIEKCKAGAFDQFGDMKIERVETIDGFKFFFDEHSTVLIRPSGTEPLLRVYSEAPTKADVANILKQTIDTILA